MTAGRRTRKTPAVRRDEIRTAARTIALESGLSAVTQRAVAEQVGIAPGLITHYVDRMDLLVAEIFRDIAREELEQVRAAVDAVSGDVDRVLVLLRELLRLSTGASFDRYRNGWTIPSLALIALLVTCVSLQAFADIDLAPLVGAAAASVLTYLYEWWTDRRLARGQFPPHGR